MPDDLQNKIREDGTALMLQMGKDIRDLKSRENGVKIIEGATNGVAWRIEFTGDVAATVAGGVATIDIGGGVGTYRRHFLLMGG